MSKKVFALTLVFVMVLSFVAPLTTFGVQLPTDVQNTQYEESAYLLKALNVFVGDAETGALRPNDTIRRSEFAKVAIQLSGLSNLVTGSTQRGTRFPDVVAGHWATEYIDLASSQGYVIGDTLGNFRPDDVISYEEAVTVLIRILGHEPAAMAEGGFPSGYMTRGAQIGLLKDTTMKGSGQATRGDTMALSYNALTIDIMRRVTYGDRIEYEVVPETILENNLRVRREFGQIIETPESSFTGPSALARDEVIIDVDGASNVYRVGTTDARSRLGEQVIAYSRENTALRERTLLLVRPDVARMNSIRIAAEDIESIDAATGEIFYWPNKNSNTTRRVKVDPADVAVFYNGVATINAAFGADLTQIETILKPGGGIPPSGYITLISTAKSDVYDLLFITKYTNYVVDEVISASHKIVDKGGEPTLTLDPADTSKKFRILRDGQEIPITDLKEFDVLSVAISEEKDVVTAVANREMVSGIIEETSLTPSGETEFTIGNRTYMAAANTVGIFTFDLDDEGDFYLDAEGRIAWFEGRKTTSENYAFLVDAASVGGVSGTIEAKLFTRDGVSRRLYFADKVRVNGTSFSGADIVTELEATVNPDYEATVGPVAGISAVAQLVTYTTNANNEINTIHTVDVATAPNPPNPRVFTVNEVEDNVPYKALSNQLGRYRLTNATVIFQIPESSVGTATTNFAVRSADMFADNVDYDVEIYDATEDYKAGAVIVKDVTTTVNAAMGAVVIDRITETRNPEGVFVHRLYGFRDGAAVSDLAVDMSVLAGYGQGDIIQYSVNGRGEIDNVTDLLLASDKDTKAKFDRIKIGELETVYGLVERKFSGSVNVMLKDGSITNYSTTGANVYVYDYSKTTNRVTLGDTGSIMKYDATDPHSVFIRIYKGEVKDIVVIKLAAPMVLP